MSGAEPSSWKVYVKEWVIVYSSDATGAAGAAETAKFLDETYHGRLAPEDVCLTLSVPVVQDGERVRTLDPVHTMGAVQTWNMRSEWKYRGLADAAADRIRDIEGVEPTVVGAETPEEQALLDYGKRMLPA